MTESAPKPSSSVRARGFQLGSVRIDPSTGEVKGPVGSQKLDPKVMEVLVALAEHPGQVVSRETLLTLIWPNVVVSDEALSRCIYELRRQLSQAAGGDELKDAVETLPKRGYRLKAEVTSITGDEPASERASLSRGTIWIVAAVAIVIVAVIAWRIAHTPESAADRTGTTADSIAVLAFVDMSEKRDQQYLSDGFAEEILNHLARSSDLRVIARTSSFSFRDRPFDIQEIASRLGVTHVLEGSVRKSGDRVRVTAQLISAADGSHLWSETYDRTLVDVFTIQDEIATSVAAALHATLRPDSLGPDLPVNTEAYERMLQGEFFYNRRGPGDVERSVAQFERSVELDPGFARAWAGLSGAYSLLAWKTDPPSRNYQVKQRDAALRAVNLEPNLALAHHRLADYYHEVGDDENSHRHYGLALKFAPDEWVSLGMEVNRLLEAGEYDAAIPIQRKFVAHDPLNATNRQILNVALIASGRLEEALASYDTMLDVSVNVNPDWIIEIPRILVLLGRYEEAVPAAQRLPAGKYRDQAMALMSRAPGNRDEAAAALARLEAHVTSPPLDGQQDQVMDAIRLAEIHAYDGRIDQAFAMLMKKRDELSHYPNSDLYVGYLLNESRLSPFLKLLHADPRWAVLMDWRD